MSTPRPASSACTTTNPRSLVQARRAKRHARRSELFSDGAVQLHAEGGDATIRHPGGVPQNMGVLNLGDDLAGSLMTTTSHRDFDIVVTAEENPGATSPSARNVMHASVKLTGHAVR